MSTANPATIMANIERLKVISKQLDEEIAAKKKEASKFKDCSAKAGKAETDSIVATAKLSELNSEIVKRQKAVDELPDVLAKVVEAKQELEVKKNDIQKQDDLKENINAEKKTLEKTKQNVKNLDITILEKEKEIEEIPIKFAKEEAKLEEKAKEKVKQRDKDFKIAKDKQAVVSATAQDSVKVAEGKTKEEISKQKKLETLNAELEEANKKMGKKLEETDEEIKKKYEKKERDFAEKVNVLNKREEKLDFGQKMVNEAIQRTTDLKQALEKIHGKPIQVQLPQQIDFKTT